MLKSLESRVFGASRRLNYISGIALTAMMCLVFFNVVCRAVWRPVLGTYEITAFFASVTISFSLAHCAAQKGHVAVTLFTQNLSERAQAGFDMVAGIVGVTLFSVLCWQSILYAIQLQKSGEVSMTLLFPFYPFVYGIAFGFLMLAIVNLVDILTSIKKVVTL